MQKNDQIKYFELKLVFWHILLLKIQIQLLIHKYLIPALLLKQWLEYVFKRFNYKLVILESIEQK
jgi:hypothetical protein